MLNMLKQGSEKMENKRPVDLQERTFLFAKEVRDFVKRLSRTICNFEDGRQLVRSSGSVAANFVEANEALSKKDFLMRIKICRKEAKESQLWLRLIYEGTSGECPAAREALIAEARELVLIFSSIISKKS
ncbi:MAG: four helix bundle protein [Acidobacteriia bacterium]|nr:four helix bundle protein [Terriglobia bacterium]